MKEIIIDTLIDSVKLIPFLFVAFLLVELLEHKFNKKTVSMVKKSGKYGPVIGSLLGAFPQCGFSVFATNLYTTRIISLGTLIAIYLSTSDEMLPILLSKSVEFLLILKILLIKIFIGMFCGIVLDIILKNKEKTNLDYQICSEEDCHCENGIIKSSIKHTISILIFIVIINFILNMVFYYFGNEYLSKIFLKDSIFGSFITSLIGLIPNCGASIMITELYLSNSITFGSLIGGLLTGSGVALVILFKTNKNIKENIKILLMTYFIGTISGIIIDLVIKLF